MAAFEQKLLRGGRLDRYIEALLRDGRIPGAAIAVVAGGETVFAKGYGERHLEPKLAANAQTIYPIASTTKAINATLIGLLVDDGMIGWDVPLQHYLPGFRLGDAEVSATVNIRDLLTMRTGLPRHDWLWVENPMNRAALIERLQYLELSASPRS
jgi:CubicO group peptidase (beta-lactamase class C family)